MISCISQCSHYGTGVGVSKPGGGSMIAIGVSVGTGTVGGTTTSVLVGGAITAVFVDGGGGGGVATWGRAVLVGTGVRVGIGVLVAGGVLVGVRVGGRGVGDT